MTSCSSQLKTLFSISCLTSRQAMRSACLASQIFLLLHVSKGWRAGESTQPQRTDIPAHVQQNLGFLGCGDVAQTCHALLFGMCMHIHTSHFSFLFFLKSTRLCSTCIDNKFQSLKVFQKMTFLCSSQLYSILVNTVF